MADSETDDDKPLDPAVEQVRRKLARLMGVSVGIMLIGVFAVLAAIVYKVSDRAPEIAIAEQIDLPSGARILDHGYGDGVISLRLALSDGSETILLVPVGAVTTRREIPIRP